jgi:hypothetical protein
MGAWGPGIFDNDLAADVRDEWREAIRAGEDAAAATARIREELESDDEPSRTEFWTGLAAAQSETGRLQPDVRDRALAVVAEGGDLELWEGDVERAAALGELAERLRGPQRKPKRLRRHKAGPDPGVATGDVLRIRSPDERRAALFHVLDVSRERGERWPVLLGLFWPPASPSAPLPPEDELARLPYLSTTDLTAFEPGEQIPPSLPCTYPHVFAVMVGEPGDAFGPSIGEVVARGIARENPLDGAGALTLPGGLSGEDADDLEWPAPTAFDNMYGSFEVVMEDVAAIDVFLEVTRRRIERFGDVPYAEAAAREAPHVLGVIEPPYDDDDELG